MKMRIAVAGELKGSSGLSTKAERLLGEVTMQLGQKLTSYELQLLMSPEYTDESLREWCLKQDAAVFLCSMKEQPDKAEGISGHITLETSFRSLIGENICNRADAILVLWNEEPYEHKGATLELLNLACRKKIPCVWISSKDQKVYCVQGSILEPYSPAIFKTVAHPINELTEESEPLEKSGGKFVELCIKQRNRYLEAHRASGAVFEGTEDNFLREDFAPEEGDVENESVRRRILGQFKACDEKAIIYNERFQSVLYMRSVLPLTATFCLALGFYAKSVIGDLLCILFPACRDGITLAAQWVGGLGYVLHAFVNLAVYYLSKSENIRNWRDNFVNNRSMAEFLRLFLHFEPYGIRIDLFKYCNDDRERAVMLKHLTDNEEAEDQYVDQRTIRHSLGHINELIDEQLEYHKGSELRYKSIVDSLMTKWKYLTALAFLFTVGRGIFQGVLIYKDLGPYEGLYGSVTNALTLMIPGIAAYFFSKASVNNYIFNYNNHKQMQKKLEAIKRSLEGLLKRDNIPIEMMNAFTDELAETMIGDDSLKWQLQYMNTEIKPL